MKGTLIEREGSVVPPCTNKFRSADFCQDHIAVYDSFLLNLQLVIVIFITFHKKVFWIDSNVIVSVSYQFYIKRRFGSNVIKLFIAVISKCSF
jgi:hypothetical protein